MLVKTEIKIIVTNDGKDNNTVKVVANQKDKIQDVLVALEMAKSAFTDTIHNRLRKSKTPLEDFKTILVEDL